MSEYVRYFYGSLRKALSVAAIVGLAFVGAPLAIASDCGLKVTTEAVGFNGASPEIRIRISNVTNHDIALPRLDLPWNVGSIGGMRVYVAMANPPFTQIRPAVPMIHPEGEVVVTAGGEIGDAVLLSGLLPQLNDARKRGPLVAFWHFAIRPKAGSCLVHGTSSAVISPFGQ